ncbi:phage tail protein [Breoghania sp. JC706]|uniref:phage tail protein n=1 Tax=Breoghania sp. JC706 TaxID=3117732 RepID=UPI00300A4DFF
MSLPLLALGPHIFTIAPLNFQAIKRDTEAKWPSIARFGARPGRQFTGFGEDPISISGLLFPEEMGGREAYEAIRATQAAAQPVLMVGWATASAARVFGKVVILRISDTQSIISREGQGRRVEYEITVAPYPDSGRLGLFN